jgi:CheY-like chemotaxis protein
MLVGWGMHVFTTTASERLVPMLSQQAVDGKGFDLLVLGLGFPGTSASVSEALASEVRQHFSGPLLLLVGADTWQPPSAFQGGETRWTSKPVRRSRLFGLLCGLCRVEPLESPVTSVERADFTGLRVMVVDDNAFSRALLRRLLELRGIEVVEARDGVEAIRHSAERSLHLVFMDIHLPGMDGVEVTRRIRAGASASASLPIVALSADVFAEERLCGRDQVFDGFLLKPISEAALDAVLQQSPRETPDAPASRQHDTERFKPPVDEHLLQPARLTPDWRERLINEVTDQLDQINAAIDRGDRGRLQRRAHDLKGLCGFFDLASVTDRAVLLHQGAAEASWEDLRAQVDALRDMLAALAQGSD